MKTGHRRSTVKYNLSLQVHLRSGTERDDVAYANGGATRRELVGAADGTFSSGAVGGSCIFHANTTAGEREAAITSSPSALWMCGDRNRRIGARRVLATFEQTHPRDASG